MLTEKKARKMLSIKIEERFFKLTNADVNAIIKKWEQLGYIKKSAKQKVLDYYNGIIDHYRKDTTFAVRDVFVREIIKLGELFIKALEEKND